MVHFLTTPSLKLVILLAFLCCWTAVVIAEMADEEEEEEEVMTTEDDEELHRREEYNRRGYVWPLTATMPNTRGWRQTMLYRIAQVQRMEDSEDRYTGWMQLMPSVLVHPNFTEHGWGLTRAPEYLMEELRASLYNGIATSYEEEDESIDDGELHPLFIEQEELNQKVLETLKSMHEESGLECR